MQNDACERAWERHRECRESLFACQVSALSPERAIRGEIGGERVKKLAVSVEERREDGVR